MAIDPMLIYDVQMIGQETKQCRRCLVIRPVTEFSINKINNDGRHSYCKPCRRLETKARCDARRLADPDAYARRQAEADRRYRLAHPDVRRLAKNEWRKRNLDKARAVAKDWCDRNRDHVRLYVRLANAKRRSNGLRNPVALIKNLMTLQCGRCAACRIDIRRHYHVDHIMPLSRGGENVKENIQLLCPGCNQKKYNKHPNNFMRERGFLL